MASGHVMPCMLPLRSGGPLSALTFLFLHFLNFASCGVLLVLHCLEDFGRVFVAYVLALRLLLLLLVFFILILLFILILVFVLILVLVFILLLLLLVLILLLVCS